MNQKNLTLITIIITKLTAHFLNLAVNIVGQCDNQVVFIKFTKDQAPMKTELRINREQK